MVGQGDEAILLVIFAGALVLRIHEKDWAQFGTVCFLPLIPEADPDRGPHNGPDAAQGQVISEVRKYKRSAICNFFKVNPRLCRGTHKV